MLNKSSSELTVRDVKIPARTEMKSIQIDCPLIETFNYCSLKLDGHWTAVRVDQYGRVSVWTRRNFNITDKVKHNPWYVNIQQRCKGPRWLIGELWAAAVPCSSITTYLAEKRDLDFYVFRVPGINCVTESKRYCNERNLDYVPTFSQTQFRFNQHSCRQMYDRALRIHAPADGIVFFDDLNFLHYKWKPDKTIDLVYSGYCSGTGKNKYGVGTIRLQTAEGHEVAKAAGISDAERKFILKHDKHLRGRVVEVKYKGIGEKGRLRHPSFIRFRLDKTARECTMYQDEELQEKWKNV